MSFLKNLFGRKQTRCDLCRESRSAACVFPYSEDETKRFVYIGVLFHRGLSHEDAIQQLATEKQWNAQSARNCVTLAYGRLKQVSG